jgi:hypothetical protein
LASKDSEKVVSLRNQPLPAFTFDMSPEVEGEAAVAATPSPASTAPAPVVQGVDLTGIPKIILLAGRGKTGKTTAARWMSDQALASGRQLLMGDIDPTNASFSSYFEGVHRPANADQPSRRAQVAGAVYRPRAQAPGDRDDRPGRRRHDLAPARGFLALHLGVEHRP